MQDGTLSLSSVLYWISMSSSLPVSDRKFGLVFTCVFAALAGYAYHAAWSMAWVAGFLVTCIVFLVLSLVASRVLHPLNKLWLGFGNLLGHIVSPITLGVIFFLLLTPVALVQRMKGRDALKMKKNNKTASWWVSRERPVPDTDAFDYQF